MVEDSEWEFKDYFGDSLIYGKGNDRVLVDKDTQKVTFRYKVKGGKVDKPLQRYKKGGGGFEPPTP